jgi:hypothetical protein
MQQILLLSIAVAIPLVLFALNLRRWVLGWVCLTLSVHIFDTTLVTNLAAARVVGLIYLPYALLLLPAWVRLAPAKAYLINFVYLLTLGIIFGFLIPWPDTTGQRPFTLTAPGRAIVYPVRLIADLSLVIFVAKELLKPGAIKFVARMLILGATISASFGIFWLIVPGFDPYYSITGLRSLNGIELVRARGLSFEPSGLGMACAYALLILLVYPSPLLPVRFPLMALNLIGFMTAYSSSGIALILAGLCALWFYVARDVRRNIVVFAGLALILVATVAAFFPERFGVAIATVRGHFDGSRLHGAVPTNLVEQVAYRLDSFDASTLLFLAANPEYILIGTGPAMIMLPATEYLPPGLFRLMYGTIGINGLPTHGPLLEVANSGLLGLGLWLFQVVLSWFALQYLVQNAMTLEERTEWSLGRQMYLVGIVFYVLQVSITSPYWSVFSGLGWAAYYVAMKRRTAKEAQFTSTALALPSKHASTSR